MRLLLTITSEEKQLLGHRARHEFDHAGGTIGRNASCAWVLPDPTNVLSARHATIAHNGRGFEITDTSTNGVYLNTVNAPIGRGNTAFLTNGDILYLGNFVLSVETFEDSTEERRRLGVGQMAVALRADRGAPASPTEAAPFAPDSAPMRSGRFDSTPQDPSGRPLSEPAGAYAPPPIHAPRVSPDFGARATVSSVDALFGETQARPPSSLSMRSAPAQAASPASRADATPVEPPMPTGFASPPSPQAAAPAPSRVVIPHDILADILGASSQETGSASAGLPGALSAASSLPDRGADSFGFGPPPPAVSADARSIGAARTPIIPDTLDFGKLLAAPLSKLQPAASGAAPPRDPAPMAPAPFATPSPVLGDLGSPAQTSAALAQPPPPPEAPAPSFEQTIAHSPLSAALSADMVSLRPPGAGEEAAGPRALDPVAVLRQRAAGGPGAAVPSTLAPTTPDRQSAILEAPPGLRNSESSPLPRTRQVSSAAASPRSNIPLAQPPASRAVAEPPPAPAVQGGLVEAFWNGLGLDPAQIAPELHGEILAECGRALRAAVTGLVPVLNARRSLKDELRMDQTRLQPKENNPLKFLPSGEAVLQALIERKLAGFLPLSQAVREGFNDIRAHEVAAIVALDAVIKNLLARFDPASMDAQGAATKLFGRGPDKTRLWDNFVRLHAALSSNLEETTRKVMGEEFARAYAQQVESARHGGD